MIKQKINMNREIRIKKYKDNFRYGTRNFYIWKPIKSLRYK